MSQPLKLALVMDNVLGWRTFTLSWKRNLPQDTTVEPTWIVLSDDIPLWIDTVKVLPPKVRRRLRTVLLVRRGLGQGPFDATYLSSGSAASALPQYMKKHSCFMAFDSTVKQLYSFGDAYGWYPKRSKTAERSNHQKRAAVLQAMHGLFPMSQWAGNSAVADYGADPRKIHVVPPGVDIAQWQPGDRAQKNDKDACDLLFVGGDFERKGGSLLLQWDARTKLTSWRLHIVTSQPVRTDDPRIHVYNDLTSNDPRLVQLYHGADAFVLPTQADCYSLAGIEALASGLPVVLGDTGGTSEIVRPGETGFLVPPGDAAALSEGLEELITKPDLRRQMGHAARADAECRYDASKLIHHTVQIMKDTL